MSKSMWLFTRCELGEVIDGDSIKLSVDLGFYVNTTVHIRLLGVDCPERNDPEAWRLAREFAQNWLTETGKITLECFGREKYGRWLGRVFNAQGKSLSDALIDSGFGVPYEGGKRT